MYSYMYIYSCLPEIRPPKMKLECLAQYTLHGNIMSMQAVHLIGSQRDSLLLSFRDAKLSVVEYDQDVHDLRTVSLHYFEEEEIKVAIFERTSRVCFILGKLVFEAIIVIILRYSKERHIIFIYLNHIVI